MADVGALYWVCFLGGNNEQERNDHEHLCRGEKDGNIYET